MRKEKANYLWLCLMFLGLSLMATAQEQTIRLTTSRNAGDSLFFSANYGVNLFIDWGDGEFKMTKSLAKEIAGELKGNNIVIKGAGLSYFDAENNALESLDVTAAPLLETLIVCNNNLTTIDLVKNVNLAKLVLADNKLATVNFGKNTKLIELNISNNQFTAVNVLLNKSLETFICADNELTALSLAQNTKLKTLWCQGNKLEGTFDLSKNKALESLLCYNNAIENLNLLNVSTLVDVWCENNKLSYLDLKANTALQTLSCDYNQLDSMSISENLRPNSVYCNNNRLRFSSLPAATYVKPNYRYNPQEALVLAGKQVLVGDVIDLRDEVYSANNTNLSTNFTWKDATGKTLVRNTDYTESQKGYFAFKKEYKGVYCTMKSNALSEYQPVTVPFDVVMRYSIKGDTNGDEKINVSDVVSIVNFILDEQQEIFDAYAADVNEDDKINVSDVVSTVSIILGDDKSSVKMINVLGDEE